MAINIIQGYNPSTVEPIDSRFIKPNSGSRYAIPSFGAYNGLVVYQQDTKELYVLIDTGSVNTSDGWQLVGNSTGSFSGSFVGNFTGSLEGTSSWAYNALTASYADNFTVAGTLTAQTLVVQTITSSTEYVTGSTRFGSSLDNTHQFTGSVSITGSLTATNANISGSFNGSISNLQGTPTHIPYFSSSQVLADSALFQVDNGNNSFSIAINQNAVTTAAPEALYVYQPSDASFNVISGKGNLDNYLQLNIKNLNNGPSASSDIVATANNGDEDGNYIDMGINSAVYSQNYIGAANDAYLYSTGNDLHIGNASPGQLLQFFAGGTDVDIHNKLQLNPNNQHIMSGSLDVSGSVTAFNFTGSLFGLASNAYQAATASYIEAINIDGIVLSSSHAIASDNAQTSDYATNASEADHAQTSDYATIAGNGGVTQIIAGTGITLTPTSGLGAVTIIAGAGGGGTTIISGSNVTASFLSNTTWTFNHGLGVRTPIITVFDSNYNQIIPQNIELTNTSSATITFPTAESGFVIASLGGTTGTVLSSSYSLFSTYADTASYYAETDPVFVAKSASLATTGSNIFKGNQTITGSLIITGSNTLIGAKTITGSVFISGSKTIIGNNTITGSFLVSGSTTQTGNNTLTGNTVLSGSISVSGSQTFKGNLNLTGSLTISGSTTQTGNNTLIGNTVLSGSISVSGSQTFKGNLDLTGSLTISGSTTQIGNNTLYGNTVLTGSNTISGSNLIIGQNTIIGGAVVTGSLYITGSTMQIGNNTLIGNTVLSGSFEVSGSTILHNSSFVVTGSTYIKGETSISGSTGITGSLNVIGDINVVSGSSFTRWGNKLFNYGAFSDYTTQSGSASTAYAIKFNTTDINLEVDLSGSSAIKIQNKGIYNFQWSGQLHQGAGASVVSIWIKINGSDVSGSRGDVTLASNDDALPSWNYVLPINVNDTVELYWSSTSANTTWVYSPAAISPIRPSTASIIATLTQIA